MCKYLNVIINKVWFFKIHDTCHNCTLTEILPLLRPVWPPVFPVDVSTKCSIPNTVEGSMGCWQTTTKKGIIHSMYNLKNYVARVKEPVRQRNGAPMKKSIPTGSLATSGSCFVISLRQLSRLTGCGHRTSSYLQVSISRKKQQLLENFLLLSKRSKD